MARRPRRDHVLGVRECACGCGESFTVTTLNSVQVYATAEHRIAHVLVVAKAKRAAMEPWRKRDILAARLDEAIGRDPKGARSRVLNLLLETDNSGYARGWHARKRSGRVKSIAA